MNHRAGLALIKSTWASWMQYRSFFFVLAFGWMIPPLVALFAWLAAAGDGDLGGMDRGAFVAYYLALVLANQLTYAQTNWTLGDVIRMGGLNAWLVRPLPALYNVLASEVAGKVVYLVFVIPVAALLALVLRPELTTTPAQVGLALVSLLLAWALRFFWGCWLALLAFWSTRADALLAVQDSLVFLLSGIAAPVMLLPGVLQTLSRVLPFRYMVGFPVEILVQPLPAGEIVFGLAMQVGWLALALALTAVVWRAGLRRYAAVGG
jgi:ABC-2 type transport system permease protein